MKGWFVYEGEEDSFDCTGILENGFIFAQHVCSHPSFAAGDLYFTRPERMAVLKEMFPEGIDWQGTVTPEKLPLEVLAANRNKEACEQLGEKYSAIHARLFPEEAESNYAKIEVEFSKGAETKP